MKRRLKWTEEEIIQKIKDWQAKYGEIPAATDWNPSDCRRSARISAARSQVWLERSERFSQGVYPWPGTVQKVFGSWNNAIRAAGFQPRKEAISELPDAIKPSDALRSIDAYLRQAQKSDDPVERRKILSQIAQKALAALETEDAGE